MIAAMPIVAVTLRGLLGRRRTFLMILLVALPVLIALLVRLADSRMDVDRILDAMLVRTVLPLVALVLGTAALGSELEDGTAVYLMIKPVPRWRIVAAKMIVAAGRTVVLVVPSALLAGVLAGGTGSGALGTTVAFSVAVALGGSAYACVFVGLSAYTSRALVVGLGYTMIWEGVLAGLLEGTRFLSIRQATLGIASGLSAPGGVRGSRRPGSLDRAVRGDRDGRGGRGVRARLDPAGPLRDPQRRLATSRAGPANQAGSRPALNKVRLGRIDASARAVRLSFSTPSATRRQPVRSA
jgi:ABC-2 type transport system permease protein